MKYRRTAHDSRPKAKAQKPKADVRIKLGRLELPTPLICASGTFGYGEELRGLTNFKAIGAFITKTITLKPHQGNPPPRIFETACGVLNSVGLENPGVERFLEKKLPLLKKLKVKYIVSVGGFSPHDYEEVIRGLDRAEEIEAIEVNISCPNLDSGKMISQDKTMTYQLLSTLRQRTSKVLLAKITPEVTDIAEIALAVQKAGMDGISLVNTFYGLAVKSETKTPCLGNIYGGYSGRAIKPLSLYRVWRVAQAVTIPIIGGGGIENGGDALEFIIAGATAASIGTINLVYPNQAALIVKEIKEYMRRKKIKTIDELKGSLHDRRME